MKSSNISFFILSVINFSSISEAFCILLFFFNLSYNSFLYKFIFLLNNLSSILNPSLIPAFFFKALNASLFGFVSKNFCNISIPFITLLFFNKISKASFFNCVLLSFSVFNNIFINLFIKSSKFCCFIFLESSFHLLK